jgi:DNA-binding MarR family transcriptional regulator
MPAASGVLALRVIGERRGISMSELAERTLTSPIAVSEVVSRLVDKDLVRRYHAPDDGRRVILSLTRSGEVLMCQIGETLPERLIGALVAMPSLSRESLADLLESWLGNAGLADARVRMLGEGH